MKFRVWLLSVLEARMNVPLAYGAFHLFWIAFIAIFTAVICIKLRECSDKTLRRLAGIVFTILIIADLYRQVVYDFVDYDGEAERFVWNYGWYAFPFQLCSSIHYTLPFVIWMRDGKVRDACISFLCFFSMLGGVCVFLFPETCFTNSIGVNIQTMLHHGMQIALGIFFAVHERKKLGIRFFGLGISVLSILILIALILNYAMHQVFIYSGIDAVFDMFYISPYYTSELPIISVLKPALPYPIFLFLYTAGVISGGLVIYGIETGIITRLRKKQQAGSTV